MKEIKDYIALYIGQKAIGVVSEANVGGYEEATIETVGVDCATFSGRLADYYYEQPDYQLQLLLRPLSDMTEEEAKKLDTTNRIWAHWHDAVLMGEGWGHDFFDAETFLILLKNGFDLFNLIEEGLAIDKTTIK